MRQIEARRPSSRYPWSSLQFLIFPWCFAYLECFALVSWAQFSLSPWWSVAPWVSVLVCSLATEIKSCLLAALERRWYASYVTFWFYCFGLVNYWWVCELKICRNSRHIFVIFVYIVQVVCCFCSILFIHHLFIHLFIYLFMYFLEPYTYPVTTNQSEKKHTHTHTHTKPE